MTDIIQSNIFTLWLYWHFLEAPKGILRGWRNFLKFGLNYFSLPLLLKTFFSPWRRYSWAYPRGFSIGIYIEVFFSNLISRFLGAMVRSFLVVIGMFFVALLAIGGLIVFLGWIILPFLIALGLLFGIWLTRYVLVGLLLFFGIKLIIYIVVGIVLALWISKIL